MDVQFAYNGTLDNETIQALAGLIDKVERDSGNKAILICHSSMEQAIKEAFPNKSVLCLKLVPVDDKTIWIVPNTKGRIQTVSCI